MESSIALLTHNMKNKICKAPLLHFEDRFPYSICHYKAGSTTELMLWGFEGFTWTPEMMA